MQRRAAEESLTDHGKDNSNGRAHVGDAIRHKPGILGFLRQIGFMGATGHGLCMNLQSRHRYHGAQSADVSGQGRACREGRLPWLPGPWCRKKAVIRSEPNEGACEFAKQGSGVRRTAVRRGGFRVRIMKLQWGMFLSSDGVARQRPPTAMARSAEPIGGDAMFEERGAASERKLARLAVARSAPPWTSSLTNRHKKGADLRRS